MMQVNKYVFKNIFLFIIILIAFTWLITFINSIQQEMQMQQIQEREPFVSKIREGYRASLRGSRNIVHDIYKYGYLYTSKMLRM